jgi:outer membrane protein assembly factor BamB
MPTPPSTRPSWANSAAPSDIATPPSATQAAGWLGGVKPPHEWVNWWWQLVGQWIDFVADTAQVFSDLTVAVDYADANLSAGDMVVVFEDDNATGPGTREAKNQTGGTGPFGGIDACGDLVVFSIGAFDNRGINRDLDGSGPSGSPICNYVRTNSGSNYAIKTNGNRTVQAYGNYVECFNATTGASIWVFDATVPVADLCICAGYVYIVHGTTSGAGDATANRQLHKLALLDGAVQWSLQHGAGSVELRSVCTNGRQVFVAGQASSYASGANMRAIRASDGYDATGECNNGADTTGVCWNRVDAVIHGTGRVFDCDGAMLYSGYPSAATYQLEAIGQGDGISAWQIAHTDGTMDAIHVSADQDYVYLCTTDGGAPANGYLEAYDKRTGALAWRWADPDETPFPASPLAAVSDGCKVFVIGNADQYIYRVSRGNVPTRFRVVDPATELVRYRNLKLQPESQ